MPQLHHRDPSIIGLLGASPHLTSPSHPRIAPAPQRTSSTSSLAQRLRTAQAHGDAPRAASEAFDELETPPLTPVSARNGEGGAQVRLERDCRERPFERPFYELIVDGIHSHPNSVRVRVFHYFLSLFFWVRCELGGDGTDLRMGCSWRIRRIRRDVC